MHLILRLTALGGIGTLAACGTIGPGYSPTAQGPEPAAQSAPTQTAALEPDPAQAAPRRPWRTAAARAEADATASVTSQDTKPVVFNSPEWKEREKRREDELNRKINSICRGC